MTALGKPLWMALVMTAAVSGSGCQALLQAAQHLQASGVQAQLPQVTYQDAVLVQSPSKAMMAAYYCPQLVPNPGGLPGAAGLLCSQFFGAPPSLEQMRVSFDLRFKVSNPNHFPIPVAELLAAATVFPERTNQSLGAACVAFCGANQPGCTGQPGPTSCQAQRSDIRSLADFRNAAAGLLISSGISALQGQTPSYTMPQVVRDAEVLVTARFSFGPAALLQVLRQLAQQAVQQLQTGKQLEFVIPYRMEGSVWLDVGSLGRVAVGFGPAAGSWTIPATQIVPSGGR